MAELVKTYARLRVHEWNKKKISIPGIYHGIPLDDYHDDVCVEPSISSTGLRKLYNPSPDVKAAPAYYWANSPYNDERIEDEEETEWMILGRAAHHLLFGEANFKAKFIQRPDTVNGVACNRTTTHGKAWFKQQKERGLTVVTKAQIKAIIGIARELAREPLINPPPRPDGTERSGILTGLIEHSWVWKHPSGVWLRMRPDATPKDSLDFVDLKLTRSVVWRDMQSSIKNYGYFMQAGLTAMGVKAILGQPLNTYTLVFAEHKYPHCIDIVTLTPDEIKIGIDACEIAIQLFNKCWKEKRWPGPRGIRDDARYIQLSEFNRKQISETLEMDKRELSQPAS